MKNIVIVFVLMFLVGPVLAWGDANPVVETMCVPAEGIHPQAVTDAKGNVHLIYFKGDPQAGDLFYIKSVDGGKTFSAPVRVNSQDQSVIAIGTVRAPQIALGKNGLVHVAWMGSNKAEPKVGGTDVPLLYARMNGKGDGFEAQRNVIKEHPGLDGGISVGADDEGNVYVAWHAPDGAAGEGNRRVWIAKSTDAGATFAAETAAIADKTGACGCCGMKIAAGEGGRVYVMYRAAHEMINREMCLLVSEDYGKTFKMALKDPFEIGICVMSTSALEPTPTGVLAAWETKGQIFAMNDDAKNQNGGLKGTAMPGDGGTRKHPSVASNSRGEYVIVWTEGTAWNQGGSIAWQCFDKTGKAIGAEGRARGLPAWSAPAAFVTEAGGFRIMY